MAADDAPRKSQPARLLGVPPAVVSADALMRFTLTIEALAALPAGTRIGLARRWPCDGGAPQIGDPAAENHLALAAEPAIPLGFRHGRVGEWHPFDHVTMLECLAPLPVGGLIQLGFGGAVGMRAQTFAEEASDLAVRLGWPGDAGWIEIGRPATRIVGGPPARLVATVPSIVAPGEPFNIHVRCEDVWGNPCQGTNIEIVVDAQAGRATLSPAAGSFVRVPLTLTEPGIHRLTVRDGENHFSAVTNPILVTAEPGPRLYWGDIHGQSKIGCGASTIADYFRHSRDFAAADFGSHQANCFLVSNAEWEETKAVTRAVHEDGRYVALLGLEWSGVTAVGGDHNLYFPGDEAAPRRCSHQHVDDKSDLASDLPHVTDLHAHYRGTDTVMAVHVGGRTSHLGWHEPALERLLEVHSCHATSEWFLFEALARGWRCGVTAGSDGVDGRLAGSHPGRMAVRNLRGGLTAVAMPALTRADLWRALKARRTHGTTGERILLRFRAGEHLPGDEAALRGAPTFTISVHGTAPLAGVELFRGLEPVFSAPLAPLDARPSAEIRLAWRGASAPGNWERARMVWEGRVTVTGARIVAARGWALDTPAEGITGQGPDHVAFHTITAGSWNGVVLTLADERAEAVLSLETNQLSARVPLATLAAGAFETRAEAPARALRLDRLPRAPASLDWSGAFRDTAARAGEHAYWLRVGQEDGAMAWSTPIWLDLRP